MTQDKPTQIEKFYAACRDLGIDGDDEAVDSFLRNSVKPKAAPKKPVDDRKHA